MWPNPQENTDMVTSTEEILNGKLHLLCSVFIWSMLLIKYFAFRNFWTITYAEIEPKDDKTVTLKIYSLSFSDFLCKGREAWVLKSAIYSILIFA